MKYRILVLFFILSVLPVFGGGDDLKNLYWEYSAYEGVTAIRLPGAICRLALLAGDLEEPERKLISRIHRLWILSVEDPALNHRIDFTKDCKRVIDSGKYTELVRVKQSSDNVFVMVKEEGGKIVDLVILTGGMKNVMVRIEGRFDYEDITDLIREAEPGGQLI